MRLRGVGIPSIPVIDTWLSTALDAPGGPVGTVEHLLAALGGMGVCDVEIEVDGPEVPTLDGSALPFCGLIRAAGLETPGMPMGPLPSAGLIVEGAEGARIEARPGPTTVLIFEGDFPGVGPGRAELRLPDAATFEREIAPARTFGLADDARRLRAAGRARGASLENCLVLGRDGRPLNPGGFRTPDESFRHKLLDLLGDLSRVGTLPRGTIHAFRGGHTLNATFVERWRGGLAR